ncbi:MAG: cobalamin biosynthesis protein, partial [Clostridia bacterium]|nr:cobalamin biosynthesis protein [Clostridia bacterium]
FAHSDYVEKTVGVGNVCERAAVKASGGRLLAGKTVFEGMTFALAGDENT